MEQKYVLTNQHLANYENIKKHRIGVIIMDSILHLFNNTFKLNLIMTPKEKKEFDFIVNQATKVAVAILVLFFTLIILTTIL